MRRIRPSSFARNWRGFSSSFIQPAVGPTRRFDSEGRTPGFARRRRPGQPPQREPEGEASKSDNAPGKNEQVSSALQQGAASDANSLLSPVNIPEDRDGILQSNHPATSILANSSVVVQRQLEMMNVFLGFEQANKYIVMDPQGGHIGYMAEQEHGMGNMMARQMLRTHRSFTTHVFDKNEREVLRFHRPFSWISSRIRVYDAIGSDTAYTTSTALQGTSPGSVISQAFAQTSSLPLSDMRIIGEAQQQWAPFRRRYNLFLHRDVSSVTTESNAPQLTSGDLPLSNSTALEPSSSSDARTPGFAQFAYVNEPFLSWDFSLLSSNDQLIGSVNRNFAGWGREIFTDTGVYALRMDAAGSQSESEHLISGTADRATKPDTIGMTLDQRAVMLATAVSIDFDYFSRHSNAGGGGLGFMPMWFPIPMGGGGAGAAEAGGAAGAGAAEAGAVEKGVAGGAMRGADGAVRGAGGMSESAAVGAGTLAGYDALQRGRESRADQQEQGMQEQPFQEEQAEDVWGDWGQPPRGGNSGGGDSGGGSGGEGGGGGGGFDMDDFF